jgi:hypothetical protein
VAENALVKAAAARAPSNEILFVAMLEMARECSSLQWDREVAEEKGADLAIIASRRVAALSALASLVLDCQRLGESDPLVSEGTFAKLKAVWLDIISEVAADTLGVADAQRLLTRYAEVLATVHPGDVHGGPPGPRG